MNMYYVYIYHSEMMLQQQAATYFSKYYFYVQIHFSYLSRCSLSRNLGRLSQHPAEKPSFFLFRQMNSHHESNVYIILIMNKIKYGHFKKLLNSPLIFQTDCHYCPTDRHVKTVGPRRQNKLVQYVYQTTGFNELNLNVTC